MELLRDEGGEQASPPLLRFVAPESALGAHRCVALSSAQVRFVVAAVRSLGNRRLSRAGGLTASARLFQFAVACAEDLLLATV